MQQRKPFPWKRSIIFFVISLVLIIVYFLPLVMNSLPSLKNFSNTLIPLLGAIAAFIVAIVPVIPLVFPSTLDVSTQPATSTTTVSNIPTTLVPSSSTVPQSASILNPVQPPMPAQLPQTPVFFYNTPSPPTPEDYFGRATERTTLINRTRIRGSVAIAGPRRIGKTWLIEYLKLIAPTHPQLGPTYRVGILSATHPHCQTVAGFVRKAMEVLHIPMHALQMKTLHLEHLATAMQDLKVQQIVPILCIDEFEGFIGKAGFDELFVEGLRAMAQDDGLVLVIVSKLTLREVIQNMIKKTSPLFNIVQQLTLKPFNQQEATTFVMNKGQQAAFDEQERAFFLNPLSCIKLMAQKNGLRSVYNLQARYF